MKTISLNDRLSLDDVLRDVARDEEIVILRDGHAVALLTPFDDDDVEWYARERAPAFLDSIARARQQVADGKVVGHDELKRQLGIE
jgi:antitoxin (DNA-binding transcriptional repressor) of toxin-antitoxin stability system